MKYYCPICDTTSCSAPLSGVDETSEAIQVDCGCQTPLPEDTPEMIHLDLRHGWTPEAAVKLKKFLAGETRLKEETENIHGKPLTED